MAFKDRAEHDSAETKVHESSDTIVAAFEGLTIGEQSIDESKKVNEIEAVKVAEDKAEVKKAPAKREPSATRVPHVIGVSISDLTYGYPCMIV